MSVNVCIMSVSGIVPEYKTAGAAGFDFQSVEDVVIEPGEWKMIDTGLYFEIPEGYELQIRSRSGLALKHGVVVLNSPATIDSDYRGLVSVILANAGDIPFGVKAGDRIAQGVLKKVERADFTLVSRLEETERGSGGFGSTGI